MTFDKVVVRRSKRDKWELALRLVEAIDGSPRFFDKNFDEILNDTIEVGRSELTPGRAYIWQGNVVYALSVNLIAWNDGGGCDWSKLDMEDVASILEAE